jgi:muramoyltetrapeptide carboxypeptidase
MGVLGPMMKHIARHGTQAEDVRNTFALLRGETIEKTCKRGEGSRNGHARAKIVGGNLSILYSLRGTPAETETKGNILFIEDVSEYRYHIDRMMQNLRFGGVLKDLAGLVVGQMTDMKDGMTKFGQDAYGIIAEAVREYDYPVLMGFPSGHEDDENQPILLGGMCDLTVTDEGGRLRMGKDA